MKRILTVVGTRPEAIKMAIVVQKLSELNHIEHRLCITGQHKQMLDSVLNFFKISPDYNLQIMQKKQDLTDITVNILKGIQNVFAEFNPELLLVHGDTTTCMASSIAGFYAGIPIAHVEAGLRTHNLASPYPEEANRVITDQLARYHFVPTQKNQENLLREGIRNQSIIITGNTVIDSLLFASDKVKGFSDNMKNDAVRCLYQQKAKVLLVTGHRRENFGNGFLQICEALKAISLRYPEMHIVYPVHLNPNVQEPVKRLLTGLSNVHLIDPLDYSDFVYAMKNSWVILTDSGGVQEEAPSLGKPVLVMRQTTERPEAVDAGTVKLVGADSKTIVQGITELWENPDILEKMSQAHNPYGDGKASDRIVSFINSVN